MPKKILSQKNFSVCIITPLNSVLMQVRHSLDRRCSVLDSDCCPREVWMQPSTFGYWGCLIVWPDAACWPQGQWTCSGTAWGITIEKAQINKVIQSRTQAMIYLLCPLPFIRSGYIWSAYPPTNKTPDSSCSWRYRDSYILLWPSRQAHAICKCLTYRMSHKLRLALLHLSLLPESCFPLFCA